MSVDFDLGTADEFRAAQAVYPELKEMLSAVAGSRYYTWEPRADKVEEMDQQTSFVESEAKFSICLGGTGSGKTDAAAYKTTKMLLEQIPQRKNLPFWVVGESFELACGVCWGEKLSTFIPEDCIRSIDWLRQERNWPKAVTLKDLHGSGTNWVIEFKSFEQGRAKFQAASIGGYWINEESPLAIVEEIQGRCRDYDSPGWADFTPLSSRGYEWPERYDEPPEGWEFFHLNVLENTALVPGFAERYLASIPEDQRETRRVGAFASFRGQVFKEWNRSLHVIDPFPIPRDWRKIRGMDFGWANPLACVWVAKDGDGRYYVYREHYQAEQLIEWHAEKISEEYWAEHDPYCGVTYADHAAAQERAELTATRLQDRGVAIPTAAARKDVMPGIECLRRMMKPCTDGKPRIYVFKNCKELISEIRSYHWPEATGKDRRMKDPVIQLPVPFRDHGIDAMRYAIFSDQLACKAFPDPVKPQEREWKRDNRVSRFLV